jgi:monoamine oxidase
VCKYSPEQKRIFGDSLLKPEYNCRVFFAGEHLSSTPSWIQGSLYTGKLAANDLAKVARNRS